MNQFNFHRFSLVLNWVLRVNWRRLVFGVAGSAVGVFIGELAINGNVRYCDPSSLIYQYAQLGAVLMLIATTIMVCGVTSSVNEKRKRETFLMLPATNFEKFLSLVVFTAVICPLCLFLSFALGDTLRMAVFWLQGEQKGVISMRVVGITYYWWSSAVPQVLDNLTPNSLKHFFWPELLLTVVGIFSIHSWYTLVGTLMRKYAFVLSNLIIIGLGVLLGNVLFSYGNDSFWLYHKTWENGVYTTIYNFPVFCLVTVVLLALTVSCYWAAFRIFRNFQLISNKWTNV